MVLRPASRGYFDMRDLEKVFAHDGPMSIRPVIRRGEVNGMPAI